MKQKARNPATLLLLEDGILLKPYNLASGVTENGTHQWGPAPGGWMPDHTCAAVIAAADTAQAENDHLARTQALLEAALRDGKRHAEQRKPWPGWVPIKPTQPADRRAVHAYRNLFKRMNPQFDKVPAGVGKDNTFGATWPPDGQYNLRSATMYFWPVESLPCPRCQARVVLELQVVREGTCVLCGLSAGKNGSDTDAM